LAGGAIEILHPFLKEFVPINQNVEEVRMKFFVTCLTLLALLVFWPAGMHAQDRFDRSAYIPADSLDIGGFGNIVVGVDFDNDGRKEIYAVNNDWYDQLGKDLVPRIYKYEQNDEGMWEVVWSTRLPLDFQNTWPPMAAADLDKDGKWEIVWGPVNNFGGGLQPNPPRIVVFETAGDGSDNMGVMNPDGTWRPNAQWTVVNEDNYELRFSRFVIHDIDSDGTDEIIAVSRRGGEGIYVISVDNVPDAADSTETWTIEFVGGGKASPTGFTDVYWDLAVLGNTAYGFKTSDTVYAIKWNGVSYDVSYQTGLIKSPWMSAQVVDVDTNGVEEILILNGWLFTAPGDVVLLEQSGDTLKATTIATVPSHMANRLYGGTVGDVDGDGHLDYVFGTRSSNPNGLIFRIEYQGGPLADPSSWQLSAIDSLVASPIQYDVLGMADLDGDGLDEVAYTGTPRSKPADDPPQPIVILEHVPANQPIITDIADVPNDQGRQVWVVWFGSADDMDQGMAVNPADPITILVNASKKIAFPYTEMNGRQIKLIYAEDVDQLNATASISQYAVWRIDNGYPVQVATTLPIQADYYAAVVPTLGDGEDWAGEFVVSAHTDDPKVFWKSFPKFGVSIDNLIPTAPSNVSASQVDDAIELTWDESPDPDFNYFSIRRGTEPGFDPTDPATEVGTTVDTKFIDNTVEVGIKYYYRVVAFDFNGNMGEFSDEIVAQVVGIDDEFSRIPKEFALYQNYPNPFNPSTTITFDLPMNANVTLVIYNTLGQKVRTLVNDALEAGTHRVVWDGRNEFGVPVANGVYIYTIKAGNFVKSLKMTLMK